MARAFDGITVLEIGQMYNGPYCGLMFAQHGAKVVKLESAAGDLLRFRSSPTLESHEFVMLNSDKESIAVDLKDERGKAVLLDAISKIDVIVENLAPGAMTRLGLDPTMLCERNPRLVYASGKGYGTEGPYAHLSAMDITVQAMSGAIASTGFPDGPPVKTGPAFVDILAGTHLFSAAVTALYQRSVTGRGQLVEVSMHDTTYPAMASPLGAIYNEADREIPERTGNRHSGMAVTPYNVYPAADGWVSIFCFTERHFVSAVEAMRLEWTLTDDRFSTREARLRNMDELDEIIGRFTEKYDRWDCVRILQEKGVPCAPVLTVHEVAEDEHLILRGMIKEVDHPRRGRVKVAGSALKMSDSPARQPLAAPTLGSATASFLAEFCGYEPAKVQELLDAEVVHTPRA